MGRTLKDSFLKFNRIRYLPTENGQRTRTFSALFNYPQGIDKQIKSERVVYSLICLKLNQRITSLYFPPLIVNSKNSGFELVSTSSGHSMSHLMPLVSNGSMLVILA